MKTTSNAPAKVKRSVGTAGHLEQKPPRTRAQRVPPETAPQYAAPALEKGIDILELLTDAEHGLSMAEIAQGLGRSVGEVFRMVVTLQRRDWLYVDHGDRYHLSTRMFELAHRNRPIRTLVEVAVPVMQWVTQQAQQSCHLTIVEGGRILVIAQVEAPGYLSLGVRTGSVLGLFNTASGQVQLAFRTPQERERLLEQHAILTGEVGISRRALMASVEKVARAGYACAPSEQLRGVTNLGCPVWDRNGGVVAAIVIPYVEGIGSQRGPSLEQALTYLQDASLTISKALGHPFDPLKQP
jgi:DNA-binding IclR family transcriptional regulator